MKREGKPALPLSAASARLKGLSDPPKAAPQRAVVESHHNKDRIPARAIPYSRENPPLCGVGVFGWGPCVGIASPVDGRCEQHTTVHPVAGGFIYLMRAGVHVKIGITRGEKVGRDYDRRDLIARLMQVQTCNALEVSMLASAWVYECREIERDLHKQYREHRVRGEWFALPDADVAVLVQWLRAVDLSEIAAWTPPWRACP